MKRKNPLVLKAIKYIEIFVLALSLSAFASDRTATEITPENHTVISAQYRLSEYDGRIAVFENDSSMPFEVFDVYVSSLPYNEQVIIRNGLTASTKAQLQQLIEDYTS